jgi:hypothetical protein
MSLPRIRRRSPGALFALVGLGFVFAPGLASAAAARIERPVTDAPAAAPAAPSSRAIPVTPIENPMREMAPGVYEGIVPVLMPDGSWQVHLDERFHSFSVVRRGEGGRLGGACVHGASGLARWRAAAVPMVSGPVTTRVTKWEDQ